MEEQRNNPQTSEKSNKTWLYVVGAIVVLALLGVGLWAMMQGDDADDATVESSQGSTSQAEASGNTDATTDTDDATAADSIEIVYTDSGFEKSSYTVGAGGTVIVKNDSSSDLQFSSDDHPAHLDNSELNQSVLASGDSQEFVVTETGTWGIHDHLNDANTTELIVE